MSIIFQKQLGNCFVPRLVGIELNPGPHGNRGRKPKKSQPRSKPNRSKDEVNKPIIASGLTASSSSMKLVSTSIPKSEQFFPDIYNAWARTVVAQDLTSSPTVSCTYKVNSPAFQFGPQINYSGAFGTNVPSGMNILLSSLPSTGSAAPYFFACTHEIEVTAEALNASSVPVYITLIPALTPTLASMPFSQIAEQRGACQTLITSGSLLPTMLTAKFAVADIMGVSPAFIHNESIFKQNAGAVPPQVIYLHIIASSFDGTTNLNVVLRTTFRFHIRFSTLNTFNSSAPA